MPKNQQAEIESGGISETGPVREDNQDSIRIADETRDPLDHGHLFGVADGMGGYSHGDIASHIALQTLYDAYYRSSAIQPLRVMEKGVESANLRVFQEAQKLGVSRMGTTLTAAGVYGRQLFLAHVGDSRAYLVRNGQATCLTHDHTAVGDLVRMTVISPDRVRTHAQRSILNRAVGLTLFVTPELSNVALQEGDRLVLCSDGLWSVVEDSDFGHLAQKAPSATDLSQALVNRALENGTDDNVSAVSVFIHSLSDVPETTGSRKWKWFESLRGLLAPRNNGTSV